MIASGAALAAGGTVFGADRGRGGFVVMHGRRPAPMNRARTAIALAIAVAAVGVDWVRTRV